MNRWTPILIALSLTLSSCAQMEVRRTAEHATATAEYIHAVSNAESFSGERDCVRSSSLGQWERLVFDRQTQPLRLGNGVSAAAHCLRIPDDASVLQFATDSQGGMTYHETTVVLPSLLFLAGDFSLVRDDPDPEAHYNSRMMSSGLDGTVALATNLRNARYLVVYVHPEALTGGVRIEGLPRQTTVPFNPYGVARIKFHKAP